jgi:hypothetical protein
VIGCIDAGSTMIELTEKQHNAVSTEQNNELINALT